MNRRPQLELIAPSASPEEAAAIVAALEQFMRNHAPVFVAGGEKPAAWQRASLMESHKHVGWSPDPWGDTHPWG